MPTVALRKYNLQEIKRLVAEYEKYFSPVALVTGFVVDSLTLTRADLWLDNLILLSYLVIAGTSILLLNAQAAGRFKNEKLQKAILLLPFAMQFAFGGLFSGFVVLYSRSASFVASWPFILTLAAILVGNEYFRNRYHRLIFQTGIYFIAIFSYLIFAVPVVLNTIGPLVFLLSGAVSLGVIALVLYSITAIARQQFQPFKRKVLLTVLAIFIIFNGLYFADIIPPIPLALKEIIIAHSIARDGFGNFAVIYEPPKWYHLFRNFNPTFHRSGNEPVYVFSAIYAPSKLKTNIIHEWSFFDESQGKWMVANKIQYSIFGGREQGYRGFSLKTNIKPGKWRVSVKTKTGQTLGQTKFKVVETESGVMVKTGLR